MRTIYTLSNWMDNNLLCPSLSTNAGNPFSIGWSNISIAYTCMFFGSITRQLCLRFLLIFGDLLWKDGSIAFYVGQIVFLFSFPTTHSRPKSHFHFLNSIKQAFFQINSRVRPTLFTFCDLISVDFSTTKKFHHNANVDFWVIVRVCSSRVRKSEFFVFDIGRVSSHVFDGAEEKIKGILKHALFV